MLSVSLTCSLIEYQVIFLIYLLTLMLAISFLFQIVEFISVLLSIGSEAAETRLIHLGAIKSAIDLFFE